MALKNTRIGTDQRFALSLSNAGAKVNMNDVEVLHLCMYSNDQRSNDGSIGYAVNADDATVLDLLWPAKSQSYLGSHSVHGTIRYAGAVASFDVPAVNVVSRTSEADISTDTIVLEAPVGTEDLTATITIQGIGPQGPKGEKGDKMTYADLTQEDKEDLYEGASEVMRPLLNTKQDVLTDTDGSYGQRVSELEKGKANLQHHHTVADITDFPELYYDATAFFASGAYPSDRYEELLEAVKAKKTVYATIDEEGYVSYVFFMSSANSDGSSSRVLLTTIFADGSNLYTNTFVLQKSGMTSLQENITGKADKAKTLAGYGIADAYTKSEVNATLEGKQDTIVDLDDIREGAAKGATALQSYTETDPVYTADKPSLALKSELNGLFTQVTNLQTKDTEQDGRLVALEQRPIVDKDLTERVTDLENDRKYAHNLANVRIKSLSVDEPIKVCDVPMVLIGSGAPSAANVPMNWDKVKMGEWFGIPNFIGQMYVNISASNNALYVAVNDTAVSGWKTA